MGIEYSVGGVSNVQLIVYDVLGREVALLVNEKKAPGTYTMEFSGSQLQVLSASTVSWRGFPGRLRIPSEVGACR